MTRPSAPPRQRPPARPSGPVRQPGQGSPKPANRRPRTLGQRWRAFAGTYGWRAYALPVLSVITVIALFSTQSPKLRAVLGEQVAGGAAQQSGPAAAASIGQLKVDDPGANAVTTLSALQLPPGPQYSSRGNGTFTVVPGRSAVFGKGKLFRFDIQIENGVQGVDRKQFAAVVLGALSDPRSWTATGQVALQRVSSGAVNFHISLTSSMSVRNLCGYSLPLETSCYDGGDRRVVLNVARWVRGAKVYASDLATYQLYAVNHEVGHALGHNHAHKCLPNGLAPVMMQQTIGTRTASGQICQANPWPFPPDTAGAPGAEQAGDGPDLDFFRRNAG